MDGAMLDADSAVRPDTLDATEARSRAHRAALRLATSANDAVDCAMLLDMLGLTAQDGLGSQPRRYQLSQRKEYRVPPNTVRVSRGLGNPWANPFVLGQYYRWLDYTRGHPWPEPIPVPDGVEPEDPTLECCSSVELAVEWHAAWLPKSGLPIAELVGKNVACWCKEMAPCHGDALLAASWRLYIDRKKTERA